MITGRGLNGGQAEQTDGQKGRFTLNSTRLVCGAGSGIVARPDRVMKGLEGETRGGGEGAGTGVALGVMGCLPCWGPVGGWRVDIGRFCGVQMLNMQMSNRIVRR